MVAGPKRSRLLRFKRSPGSLKDPGRRAGGLAIDSFAALTLAERRSVLRRSLRRPRPTAEFWLAARDPELRAEAFRSGLAVLAEGRAAWAPLVLWQPPSPLSRRAIVHASQRATATNWETVARALGHVGGRAASKILRERFEQLRRRSPRNYRDHERLLSTAAALVRVSPNRADAAQVLLDGLAVGDELVRSAAARAIRDASVLRAGEAPAHLRARLRDVLPRLDAVEFYVLCELFHDLWPRLAVRECIRHLPEKYGDTAAYYLAQWGGRAGRAHVFAWLKGKRRVLDRLIVVGALGAHAPELLIRATILQGLRARSPFDRLHAVGLLGRRDLRERRAIATRAIGREPDREIRIALEPLLCD